MLTAASRILSLAVFGAWIDRLPVAIARWVRFVVVLVVGFTPLLALWTDRINYSDAMLWLQIETVTIWFWSSLRIWVAGRPTGSSSDPGGRKLGDRGFARTFFPLHYGGFTVLPLVIGAALYGRDLPPRATWVAFVVVGLLSLLVYGWSMRGALRTGVPFGALDWAHAYARMAVSYAALFVGIPLVPHESNGVPMPGNPDLGLALGSVILGAKLVVEVVLWALREWHGPRDAEV
jgi:hypothetical protein